MEEVLVPIVVIPTIFGGKRHTNEVAIAAWRTGENPDVGSFADKAMAEDYDEDSATLVERIATRIKFGPEFAKALASFE